MADKVDMTAPMLSLDATLDDIESLPSFGSWPTGAYKVQLPEGITEKEISNDTGTKYFFDVQMTLEIPGQCDPTSFDFGESPPAVGDKTNFLFDRQHKGGQSRFADFCKPISDKFGCKTVRETIEKSKGLSLLVVVKREKNSKTGKSYSNIQHSAVI